MAAGVFEITAMVHKYALLQPALNTMYGKTRPASATLVLDRVSDALVDSVRRMPGVADAEARPLIVARVRIGPVEWVPAVLQVVRDFDAQRIHPPDGGAWPRGLSEAAGRTVPRGEGRDRRFLRPDRALETAQSGRRHGARTDGAGVMEHMVPGFVLGLFPRRRDRRNPHRRPSTR
jgi:hypothetical protein